MKSEKDRAGALFSKVLETFTRKQHRETFEVVMNLFLTGRGQPLPQLATVKSPSAISRFLNHYQWNVRHIIRMMRQHVLTEFQRYRQTPRGRNCKVELIVDMTSLPKEGRFEHLGDWMHHFNGVTGIHLVVLYFCCGELRLPWSFLLWRGKGHSSPSQLALKLLAALPPELVKRHSRVPHVLADAGFSGKAFIGGVVSLGFTVSVSIQGSRLTTTGKSLRQIQRQGKAVMLNDLPGVQLWMYWVLLPRAQGGKPERRYVVSSVYGTPSTIRKNGSKRWRIEALFKVLKSRFGLHRFGQSSKQGVLRYLCLSFLSYVFCHLEDFQQAEPRASTWPDWGDLARQIRWKYCGLVRLSELQIEIEALQAVLDSVLLI